MDDMSKVIRGGATGVFFAACAFAAAFILLPDVPAGEWSWLIRGFASLVIGGIVFGLIWFLTVASVISEVFE